MSQHDRFLQRGLRVVDLHSLCEGDTAGQDACFTVVQAGAS